MDIGADHIVLWIASSTTSNLATYSTVFEFMIGIVLAFAVITFITGMARIGDRGHHGDNGDVGLDFDDTIEI